MTGYATLMPGLYKVSKATKFRLETLTSPKYSNCPLDCAWCWSWWTETGRIKIVFPLCNAVSTLTLTDSLC